MMKIQRIEIENFRSVESASFDTSDFNVFVGQNNHGKTNIFEALNWFYSLSGNLDEIKFMKDKDKVVSVVLHFYDISKDLENLKNEKQKVALEKIIKDNDTIKIRRISTYKEGKQRQIFNEEENKWEDPIGRDTAWRDLIPKFEYISARKHLEDVAKYGKSTPIGEMLSGVLEVILEQNEDYLEFKKKFEELFGESDSDDKTQIRLELDKLGENVAFYLKKQFPDCVSVEFKVDNPEIQDLLKRFSTGVNDGILSDASEKGDGMQRALMLSIIQSYTEFRKNNEDVNKTFIFMIDEGELHLHPTAQRALKKALLDISGQGDQVLINTHSSVLVVDDFDDQIIFKVEKIGQSTTVTPVRNSREKSNIVYELLGGSPADLLLPKNFLIVEGPSEFQFIDRVISRFYEDKPEIQIVYAEGDLSQQRRSVDAINKLYTVLYVRPVYRDIAVILCDKPSDDKHEEEMDKFKEAYPELETNNQLFILPSKHIEGCYPESWKKTDQEVRNLKQTPQGHEKVQLAKECGDSITQDQFEQEMEVVFQALSQCWKLSYK